jgi:DNA adenine methylase
MVTTQSHTTAREPDGEPFLKWAGGKTQLLSQLDRFFPQTISAYYEPFMGSAAIFFFLRRTRGNFPAWLNDSNPELVNCFQIVRERVDALIPRLREHREHHNPTYYYRVRAQIPAQLSELERAARLIYLNKTCFNGLYRVNARGQFNVPLGTYKQPRIFVEANLRAVSRALQNTVLARGDFRAVLDRARTGDTVYFDPPYYTETNGFTSYAVAANGKTAFGADAQARLAAVARTLAARDCRVVVSNSDTEFIRGLYRGFNIHTVRARRAINSNARGRGPINEVVITCW